MIRDGQTNFVFIADTLSVKYPKFAKEFVSKLKQAKIPFDFLLKTKDVWAADYMPVQVSEKKFVRFTYKPDYLISTKKWSRTITDVDSICDSIGIQTIKTDIIVDGGNISRWVDKVIMTDKVFIENNNIPELELIEQLKNMLEVNKIFFVPVQKYDWLGHVDGMARFLNEDLVLVNDYSNEKQKDYINFLTALHNSGLKWTAFPFDPYDNEDFDDAAGLYLNFLELENHLILPIFQRMTDNKAIERARELFPDKEVIAVKSNEPAKHNGIINCLTWNIKK